MGIEPRFHGVVGRNYMSRLIRNSLGVVLIIFVAICMFRPSFVYADAVQDIEQLISKGKSITNDASSEAYVWVNDVMSLIENYKDSTVYPYVKGLCNEVKGRTSISNLNEKNRIIGALMYLEDVLNGEPIKTPLELVGEGAALFKDSLPEAYKWIFEVLDLVECNPDSTVYNSIKNKCLEAKERTSISNLNEKNLIIADLTTLDREAAILSEYSELIIVRSPYKTDYVEGELFDSTGVEVNAVFNNTYKDGSTKTITKKITDFSVDTTTKLKHSDTKWRFSYSFGGVTKSVDQDINVSVYVPELVDSTLVSISIASKPKKTEYLIGEVFNSKGLKVNAKYKNLWSDGTTTYTTTKNVEVTVDDTTPLTKKDKKWSISYYDNGVTVKTTVKIKVKSADPTLSDTEITLSPGDKHQLRILGTEKYVMWRCEENSCISLNDSGLVQARTAGTVKVTATIGSGKKNIKLTCTVTVKPKVTVNKSVIFVNNDEYETIKVKTAKKKTVNYKVTGTGNIKLVDEGDGLYDVVPETWTGNGDYYSTITISSINNDGYQYTEQKVPVIIYGDKKKKKITLTGWADYNSDKSFSRATFYFSGNESFRVFDEKYYKLIVKYLGISQSGGREL